MIRRLFSCPPWREFPKVFGARTKPFVPPAMREKFVRAVVAAPLEAVVGLPTSSSLSAAPNPGRRHLTSLNWRMTKMRGFDYSPFYRATVGFDRVFDLLDNVAGQ